MAILDLPESILQSLSSVLTQLQQVLPAPKQPTDFSAIAFRWENQQLLAIQQPKKMYLEEKLNTREISIFLSISKKEVEYYIHSHKLKRSTVPKTNVKSYMVESIYAKII